jgi:hypothetical protein
MDGGPLLLTGHGKWPGKAELEVRAAAGARTTGRAVRSKAQAQNVWTQGADAGRQPRANEVTVTITSTKGRAGTDAARRGW